MLPQASASLPKLHRCSKCTRSFATKTALDGHRRSTGHDTLFCTAPAAPACTKAFLSNDALTQHMSSPVHTAPLATPTNISVVIDGSKVTMQPAKPTKAKQTTGKQPKNHHTATVESRTQSQLNSGHRKTSVIAQISTQKSFREQPQPPMRASLFRWDARWSAIPTTQYGATMTALRGLIPTTETFPLTSPQKQFWTPDHTVAPSHDSALQKRQAIVLDCEMVGIGPTATTSELARLSAIDCLTGQLLIDRLVQPLCAVMDWRTQWSGITAEAMKAAVASGDALKGSPAARTELFKYMDSETVLVGHALHYDLAALGILHEITIDSAVLAKKAVGKGVKKEWGLKLLCKELLKITVQDYGKDGHDSVEDALAAREVVLWCLKHEKELRTWGDRKKKEVLADKKRKKARQKTKRQMKVPQFVDYDDSDEYEFRCVSVEELNEMCCYPEWYDNWSD